LNVPHENPKVSICCITYNHANYIRDALEGFLMQKTSFPIEIIIHDDASTDGTADIIRQYHAQHPDLIKPILQEKNQYSQGKKASLTTFKHARGKYIALCEGDDYWTDPLKLQQQLDAMNLHDAILVCHSTWVLYYGDNKIKRVYLRQPMDHSGYLNIEEILMKKSDFHTSSILVRSEFLSNLPEFYYTAPIGDYPLKILAAHLGKVFFIDRVMSVHRKGILGSWSEKMEIGEKTRKQSRLDFESRHVFMFVDFDRFSNNRYHQTIKKVMGKRLARILKMYGNLDFLQVRERQKIILRSLGKMRFILPRTFLEKVIGLFLESVWNNSPIIIDSPDN
jgi:glycosyltransferase involved in cell wall biosynthesis